MVTFSFLKSFEKKMEFVTLLNIYIEKCIQ
jgi:hypothetical protein